MFINAVLQKYPELKRPEALFEITNILNSQNETKTEANYLAFRRNGNNNLMNVKIKPPFSTTWYEGYLGASKYRLGFLMEEIDNILYCRLYQVSNQWGIDLVSTQRIGMDNTFVIPQNHYTDVWVNPEIVEDTEGNEEIHWGFNNLFYSVHYTNGLLNCKNVSTDAHDFPNRRTIQHYKRIGKPYFEKYYTLKLEIPGNKKNRENNESIESDGYTRAFHICRGHFKIYTEANPLFGKYTGTYWWNSQVRGDIKTGIIDKDYCLKQSS